LDFTGQEQPLATSSSISPTILGSTAVKDQVARSRKAVNLVLGDVCRTLAGGFFTPRKPSSPFAMCSTKRSEYYAEYREEFWIIKELEDMDGILPTACP